MLGQKRKLWNFVFKDQGKVWEFHIRSSNFKITVCQKSQIVSTIGLMSLNCGAHQVSFIGISVLDFSLHLLVNPWREVGGYTDKKWVSEYVWKLLASSERAGVLCAKTYGGTGSKAQAKAAKYPAQTTK